MEKDVAKDPERDQTLNDYATFQFVEAKVADSVSRSREQDAQE